MLPSLKMDKNMIEWRNFDDNELKVIMRAFSFFSFDLFVRFDQLIHRIFKENFKKKEKKKRCIVCEFCGARS